MESKEKTLFKNTLLFSVGNIGAKLLMLLIVPFYTYFVSVEKMGEFDVINTYIGLLSPVVCLAIYEGIYRWLLDKDSSNENVIKNGFNYLLGSTFVFNVIMIVLLNQTSFTYIPEFIALIDASILYTFAQFTTRGLRNNKVYAFQGIIYSVILITLQIILVFRFRLEAKGLLLSMAVAYFATSLYMLLVQRVFSKYYIKGKIDHSLSKELLKYSIPMLPTSVAWWMVSAGSRLIINYKMGDAANGVYAIAMKFPTIVTLVATFFYQAWQEQAIREYKSKQRDLYYSTIFNAYVRVLFSSIIALLPVTKIVIIYLMDPAYQSAFKYVGFLYLASVFNAFAAFYGTGYLSAKKTSSALTTALVGAILNIVITFLAIDKLGLYAAAVGNMLGYAIILLLRIIHTKKFFSIRAEVRLFVTLLLASIGTMLIMVFLNSLLLLIALEVVACTLFVLLNRTLLISVIKSIGSLIQSFVKKKDKIK